MKNMSKRVTQILSSFSLHPSSLIYRGVTHPGRTLTARDRGVLRGASASRPGQSLGRRWQEQGQESGSPADCSCFLSRGPRSRHRSSKPIPKELGGRHEVQLLRGLPQIKRKLDAE